jgi:hypothetical protein
VAFIGLLLIAIGLFHALAPSAAWYMSIGWKLKDAEPSDEYLMLNRVGGVIGTIVGVVLLFAGFAHP